MGKKGSWNKASQKIKDLNHSGGSTTMGSLKSFEYQVRTSLSWEGNTDEWHDLCFFYFLITFISLHSPAAGTRARAAALVNQSIRWSERERRSRGRRWFPVRGSTWCSSQFVQLETWKRQSSNRFRRVVPSADSHWLPRGDGGVPEASSHVGKNKKKELSAPKVLLQNVTFCGIYSAILPLSVVFLLVDLWNICFT